MHLKTTCIVLLVAFLKVSAAHGQVEDFEKANFRKADSMAELYPHYTLRDIRGLSRKLTEPLGTDVEKFRAIYLWTCLNIENDYYLFRENQLKRSRLVDAEGIRQWNNKFFPVVMETLLKKQRTVCTGYAYLIRELALHAGLACVMIDGYGRTSQANIGGKGALNHSWNAIKLNNKWYLCDATWSSGAIDMVKAEFSKNYNDTYFLLEPKLFINNHYPLDSAWTLTEEKPTLVEFLERPLVYSAALQCKLEDFEPKTFKVNAERGKPVLFSFVNKGNEEIQKVEIQVRASGSPSTFTKYVKQLDNGSISFEHIFSYKGQGVVHILVNGNYILSYTVEVI